MSSTKLPVVKTSNKVDPVEKYGTLNIPKKIYYLVNSYFDHNMNFNLDKWLI